MTSIPLRYCPSCGSDGLREAPSNKLNCSVCGLVLYMNIAATASLVIRCGEAVLMTRRAAEPAQGKYDFPGGFVEAGESLEQALIREIGEELSYQPRAYQYLASEPNCYAYRGRDYDLCDAYFLEELQARPDLKAADDVAGFEWFALDSIARSRVAFESVWKIVQRVRRLSAGDC